MAQFSGGRSDVFVTRLNPTGSALIYSTFLGTGGGVVALDETNAAVVAGTASNGPLLSGFFPTTPGAYDICYNSVSTAPPCLPGTIGAHDAFVAKLNMLPTGADKVPGSVSTPPGAPIAIGVTSWLQQGNAGFAITATGCPSGQAGAAVLATGQVPGGIPMIAGTQATAYVDPATIVLVLPATCTAHFAQAGLPIPGGIPGFIAYAQWVFVDPTAPGGVRASNALQLIVQP